MSTLSKYILGFVLSLVLTLAAAGFVGLTSQLVPVALVILAVCQLMVQLVLFLHLGQEKRSGNNLTVFAFALIIVCIVVGGTLWIMNNLQSQHTMPQEYLNDVPAPQNQLQ